MTSLKGRIFSLVFALVLAGCSSPHVMLDRAVVQNATTSRITDVKVQHEPTRNIGQVSMILPQKSLVLGFSRQPMLATSAIVTWKDRDGLARRAEVNLPRDQAAAKERQTMSLVYTIQPSGNVSVRLMRSDVNN
ncbi:MAG: hypothetical protein ACYSUN_16870 [Planctomycetota bacterium]